MATAATLLTAVDSAITALLDRRVAEYQIGSVRYRYEDLKTLWAMRKDLQAQTRAAGSRIRLANLGGA